MEQAAELQPRFFDSPELEPVRLEPTEADQLSSDPHVDLLEPDVQPIAEATVETEVDLSDTIPEKVAASRGILRAVKVLPSRTARRKDGPKPWWGIKKGCSNCTPGMADMPSSSRNRGCQNCGSHAQAKGSDQTSQH